MIEKSEVEALKRSIKEDDDRKREWVRATYNELRQDCINILGEDRVDDRGNCFVIGHIVVSAEAVKGGIEVSIVCGGPKGVQLYTGPDALKTRMIKELARM